jgi:hypothetical protein
MYLSNKTNSPRLALETLEDRLALSATNAWLNAGILNISSNNNASNVAINQSGTLITISDSTNGFSRSFTASSVTKVSFVGGSGADRVINNVSTLPMDAWGMAGNDYLEGYGAVDRLIGGDGDDTLVGYGGNDQLWGDAGNDTLRGMDGNDQLIGGSGNDWLYGGTGTDQLWGDGGNDWLEAGAASESAIGGDGTDWNAHVWAIGGTGVNDIQQQGSPTCSFLASLSSIARTGYNLSGNIRYLGNQQYGVRLWQGASWREFTVNFNGSTTWNDPASRTEGESWVVLYQRAYIQLVGGDGSSWPYQAQTAITGRATTRVERAMSNSDFYSIEANLAANRSVVTATRDSGFNSAGGLLVRNHAYSVVGVTRGSGGLPGTVTVRNPWAMDGGSTTSGIANDGYIVLSWAQFVSSMQGYWVN